MTVYAFSDYVFDDSSLVLMRHGMPLPLDPRAAALLAMALQHRPHPLTYTEMSTHFKRRFPDKHVSLHLLPDMLAAHLIPPAGHTFLHWDAEEGLSWRYADLTLLSETPDGTQAPEPSPETGTEDTQKETPSFVSTLFFPLLLCLFLGTLLGVFGVAGRHMVASPLADVDSFLFLPLEHDTNDAGLAWLTYGLPGLLARLPQPAASGIRPVRYHSTYRIYGAPAKTAAQLTAADPGRAVVQPALQRLDGDTYEVTFQVTYHDHAPLTLSYRADDPVAAAVGAMRALTRLSRGDDPVRRYDLEAVRLQRAARALGNGIHAARGGAYQTARSQLEEAALLAPNAPEPPLFLAAVLSREGRHAAAAYMLERALVDAERLDDPLMMHAYYRQLSEVAEAAGDPLQAEAWLKRALALKDHLPLPAQVEDRTSLARLYLLTGREEEAETLLYGCMSQVEELCAAARGHLHMAMGRLAQARGHAVTAAYFFTHARAQFQKVADHAEAGACCNALEHLEDTEEAVWQAPREVRTSDTVNRTGP